MESKTTGKDETSLLNCGVCLERYRCPKLLPCFHTFCQRCVEQVAGTKPSFPCPTCHTVTLLPPGGAAELQTNIYLEKDLARALADSGPECQLCTSGSPALVKCVQCQQLYCQKCRQTHDAIPVCSSHTVVSVGEGVVVVKPGAAVQKPSYKNCLKHKTQPLMLFCRPCDVTICLQCKLTSHEGHETEDVQDSGQRARSELLVQSEALAKKEQALNALISQAEDLQAELDKQKDDIKRELLVRSEKFKSMVTSELDKSQDDLWKLTSCLQSSLCQQTKPVQMAFEAVRAKGRHVTRVLGEEDDSEVLKLLGELKTSEVTSDNTDTLQGMKIEIGSIVLRKNDNVVTESDILVYIGTAMEGPLKKVSISETLSTLSVNGWLQLPRGNQALGSHIPPKRGKHPGEVEYSRNPTAVMVDMFLTASEKLWILFSFPTGVQQMGLFGKHGEKLELCFESINVRLPQRLACEGDTLVLLPDGKFTAPGGKSGDLGQLNVVTTYGWLLSRPSSCYYIMKTVNTAGPASIARIASLTSTPPQLDSTDVCSGIIGIATYTQAATAFAVSSDEKFFAFLLGGIVYIHIYSNGNPRDMKQIVNYNMQNTAGANTNSIVDLIFSPADGEELLVVASTTLNAVHIIDHKDGCCLVGALETTERPIEKPFRLAANGRGRLWVGCHGGNVLMYDL